MKIPKPLKITVSVILVLVVLAISGLAAMQHVLKLGREDAAISTLHQIHKAQTQFKTMRGRYGTLEELEEAALIGHITGPSSQYRYWISDLTPTTFCAHAIRVATNVSYHDFNLSEDGIIHSQRSTLPGTIPRGLGVAEQR